MSLIEHMGKRRMAVVGFGVVAASLFGAAAPAVAAPTATPRVALSSSTPTVGIGGTAKLKFTVKPVKPVTVQPTGTVTFKEGATVVGPGPIALALVGTVMTARLDLATLAVGSHTFTATYSGDATFILTGGLPVTIVVGKTATTTTASTSTPSPTPGQDTKVKAVVKQASGSVKPTGTVAFTEGASNYGTVTLALVGTVETAKATIPNLAVGTHVITATYSGSTTSGGSTSTVSVTVGKANTTSTLTTKPGTTNPLRVTIAVSVGPTDVTVTGVPTGVVTFIVDGLTGSPVPVSLGSTGRAQFAQVLTAGPHSVKVTYPGDTAFNSSTATLAFTA